MYLAREEDNTLLLFNDMPRRIVAQKPDSWGGYWCPKKVEDFLTINPNLFQQLKWEDEPLEVDILAKGSYCLYEQGGMFACDNKGNTIYIN